MQFSPVQVSDVLAVPAVVGILPVDAAAPRGLLAPATCTARCQRNGPQIHLTSLTTYRTDNSRSSSVGD